LKVLIVKLSAFGDIIHALPALDDLLDNPAVSSVHWLIDSRFGFVSDIFPEQVKVHKVALKGDQPFRHAWDMIQLLRQEQFDYIFDLQGLIKSGLMARASLISPARLLGFDKTQSPEYPNRWLVEPVSFHPDEKHVVQIYRRIVHAMTQAENISAVPETAIEYRPPSVRVDKHMVQLGSQWLAMRNWESPGLPLTIIHVGGSYATKRMHDMQWRVLLEKLTPQSRLLILWGSEEEQLRARRIAHDMSNTLVADAVLSLSTLAGLFGHASAYIGQDTGVTHLAAACACPSVTLWGPTAPWRMGPQGPHCRDIYAHIACAPCFSRQCKRFICMPSIASDAIIRAWQEIHR